MSLSQLNFLWNFLSENEVVPIDDSKYDKLKCSICKKLMADAYQSHCQCQYCFKCLTTYIGNEDKCCPGDKEDCKEEKLVLDGNVSRNVILNKDISKVKVNCLNQSCEVKVTLIEITDHLRLCSKQPVECPYHRIGCCNKKANKDLILAHLGDESLSHTELLIDCINNLKEDSLNNERRMTTRDENLMTIKSDIEGLRRDVGNMLIIMTELREKYDEEKERNENKISAMEIRMKEENDGLRGEIDAARCERKNMLTIMNEMREKMEKYDEERERKIIYWSKWSKLCPNIDVDFVWKMEQCAKNINQYLYSESFYSNNYKFCLRLRIYNDNIELCFIIMMGDNDDNIQWPMTLAVTLSIVDQDSLRPYKSEIFKYDTFNTKMAFNKPPNIRNDYYDGTFYDSNYDKNSYWIGSDKFTKYSSIKDNTSIITNDSIVVSFALYRL